MSNKEIIEQAVLENPGIRFNELKRKTGLTHGVLQYHIHKSEKIEQKKGVLLPIGYCSSCSYYGKCNDICLLKLYNDPVKKEIISGLKEGKKKKELAENLNLDKSTISYHLKQIKNSGLEI